MKLQQLQIFQNLTEEELEKSLVCSQAVVKKYPKGTYIFRQGDAPLKLYFILEASLLTPVMQKQKVKYRFWRFHRISLAEDAKEIVYITVRLCSICFSFLRKKQRNITVR